MKPQTDHQMEATVGRMLQIGVLVSATVVAVGGLLWLIQAPTPAPDYTRFVAQVDGLEGITGALRPVKHGSAGTWVQLGILLLIATPITRVVFCVVGFLRQRDRLYVLISSIVLLILLYSLVQGR